MKKLVDLRSSLFKISGSINFLNKMGKISRDNKCSDKLLEEQIRHDETMEKSGNVLLHKKIWRYM